MDQLIFRSVNKPSTLRVAGYIGIIVNVLNFRRIVCYICSTVLLICAVATFMLWFVQVYLLMHS